MLFSNIVPYESDIFLESGPTPQHSVSAVDNYLLGALEL